MARSRTTGAVLAGTLLLFALFALPVLLDPTVPYPFCPLPVVQAQDSACLAQESTLSFQRIQIQTMLRTDVARVARIENLESTLSVQEAQMALLLRTDVARQLMIDHLESTLAVADTALDAAQTTPPPVTGTAQAVQVDAGVWSSTVAGDCLPNPDLTTVAVEGNRLTLTTELASSIYDEIAPGVYLHEQSTETYTLQSTLTVVGPRHMQVEVINQVGGETFRCAVQMTWKAAE